MQTAGSSESNVHTPAESIFVDAETAPQRGYETSDNQNYFQDDDDDEEESDDIDDTEEEKAEPFDEEELGSWLRLRKWRRFVGRITRSVGKASRLCAGAVLAWDMDKIDQCQDRIGMSFAREFI